MINRNSKGQFVKGHSLGVRFGSGQTVWNKGLKSGNHGNGFKKGNIPWHAGLKTGLIPKTAYKVGQMVDEKHPKWKGDKAGYAALHTWVRRKLGRALWCTQCFSYVNVQWANISHKYKRDLNDWMQLCYRCHRKYDRQENWGAASKIFLRDSNNNYGQRKDLL